MRVALINHSGEISGAEVSLLGIADALARSGVRLVLIVPASGDLGTRARAAGHQVRTAPFPAPRLTHDPRRLAVGLAALMRGAVHLTRILREEDVDLVHANSVRAGLLASFGRLVHRKPVIWSIRDFVPVNAIGLGVRLVASVGAARLIGNSDAVSADFARWSWLRARSHTIYPGLLDDALQTAEPGDLRGEWGVPPGALVVGCVGQIAPWKRIHDVISAFAKVVAELPASAWLVIAGAPRFRAENQDYLRRLHRLVNDRGLGSRVVFVGHREDVDRVFRSVDVLVHAAEREPFGRVLIEAMAQRVPVVAVADGGIPEIVLDGKTGFLVPGGDTATMAARVLDLLRDESLRRRMGGLGRIRVVECFSVERAATQAVEIYEAVMRPSA